LEKFWHGAYTNLSNDETKSKNEKIDEPETSE